MKTKVYSKNWKLVAGISLFLMAIIAGIAFGVFYPKLENAQINEVRLPNISLIGFISCFILIAFLDVLFAYAFYNSFENARFNSNKFAFLLRLIYAIMLIYSLLDLISLNFNLNYSKQELTDAIRFFYKFWSIALIVFGFHLIILSNVICRLKFGPKFLPFLLLLAGVLYATHHSLLSFLPAYFEYSDVVNKIIALPCAASELLLAFYLIKLRFQGNFTTDSAQ